MDLSKTVQTTAVAAYALNRKPRTLMKWACTRTGLLQPVRIGRRLGWRTSDILQLTTGGKND